MINWILCFNCDSAERNDTTNYNTSNQEILGLGHLICGVFKEQD